MYACRLQVQERLTQQIAAAVFDASGGAPVLVVCSAAHMCMVARGVEQHAAATLTTAARGGVHEEGDLRGAMLQRLCAAVEGAGGWGG